MTGDDAWRVVGTVVHGLARRRAIGFPTASIEPSTGMALPVDGVYAGVASCAALYGAVAPAAISVGPNPTFQGQHRRTIEAQLLDFDGELYGQRMRLQSISRIRDMTRFEDTAALVAAIRSDVEVTRRRVLLLISNMAGVEGGATALRPAPSDGGCSFGTHAAPEARTP